MNNVPIPFRNSYIMKTYFNLISVNKFTLLSVMVILFFNTLSGQETDQVRYYIQTNQPAKAKSLLLKEQKSASITSNRIYLLGKLLLAEQKQDSAAAVFNTLNSSKEEERLLKLVGISTIELKSGNMADINIRMMRDIKAFTSSKSAIVKLEAAMVLARVGESVNAWDLIESACNLKPVSAENFVSAGDVFMQLSVLLKDNTLYGKACGRYEQALLCDGKYLPAMTALANAYINSRNFMDAKQKLTDALAIDPNWIPALKLMGELQYDLGNYTKASDYYTQYISKVNPTNIQMQKYAYILYFNKEYDKAKALITGLLAEDPQNGVLLRLMAYTSCELKDATTGLKAMESFLKIRQTGDSTSILASDFEYYGRLLSMLSKDSLAIVPFIKSIQIDSTKLSTYEFLAKSYEKLGRYQEAVNVYEVITAKDPKYSATVWFSKGRSYMLLAESPAIVADTAVKNAVLTKAVNSFNKVTELSAASHLGFLWKGRAQAALDPESTKGLAEDSYLTAISLLESKNLPDKYRVELIEAYSYLGYLNYLRFDSTFKINKEESSVFKSTSMDYWNKILALDGNNQAALQAVKALKN